MRRVLERLGRKLIVWILGVVLGVRRRVVSLPARPRILVVRLDERVGNVLLLTPLLSSLRARFPEAVIDLLAHPRGATLLHTHPDLTAVVPFDKRAWFAEHGPLRVISGLRERHYDLAIDATNPTDPSATQAIVVRLSGAAHTVGFDHGGFGRLFSARVVADERGPHEIDMRLALLDVLPGDARRRRTSLGELPAIHGAVAEFLAQPGRHVVVNVGARTAEKRLSSEVYAALARAVADAGMTPLFTYGPQELTLAQEAQAREPRAVLAPPTSLIELGHCMRTARAVITCDTGPMHLAVALQVPTCGLFVSTDPLRYGYSDAQNRVVDLRHGPSESALHEVRSWLATLTPTRPEAISPLPGR